MSMGISFGKACRLFTAKSQSTRGASHHPAFVVRCLTISQKHMHCPPCG